MRINSIFGPMVSRRDVATAVISHLQAWMPDYLAEVERQEDLAPHTIPVPPDSVNSWKIGVDFNTWFAGAEPTLIVLVTPSGMPERQYSNGTYLQDYMIQVGAIVIGDDEDDAITLADYYGLAVAGAIMHHGSIGTWTDGSPVSINTRLTASPSLTFPFPDSEKGRRVVRSTLTVHAIIDNVLVEAAGPVEPSDNPYDDPGPYPVVDEVNVTITPEDLP